MIWARLGEPSPTNPDPTWVAPGEQLDFEGLVNHASIEIAWDQGEYREAQPPIAAPTSGSHTLKVRQRDRLGRVSPPLELSIQVDDLPPSARWVLTPSAVVGPKGHYWVCQGTVVSVLSEDQGSGVDVQNIWLHANGQSRSIENGHPITAGVDLRLSATVFDRVGQQLDLSHPPLSVDITAPEASLDVSGPSTNVQGRLILSPKANISTRAVDRESGIVDTLFNVNGTRIQARNIHPPIGDQVHRAELLVIDACGNQSTPQSLSFLTDNKPPEFHIDYPNALHIDSQGVAWHRRGAALLQISVSDDLSGVAGASWSASGKRWRNIDQPIATRRSSITFKATDFVDNRLEWQQPIGFDKHRPVIKVEVNGVQAMRDQANHIQVGDPVKIRSLDEESGVGQRDFAFRHSSWKSLSNSTISAKAESEVVITAAQDQHSMRVETELTDAPTSKARNDCVRFSTPGLYRLAIKVHDRVGRVQWAEFAFAVGGSNL